MLFDENIHKSRAFVLVCDVSRPETTARLVVCHSRVPAALKWSPQQTERLWCTHSGLLPAVYRP